MRRRNRDLAVAVVVAVAALAGGVGGLSGPSLALVGVAMLVATGYVVAEALLGETVRGFEQALLSAAFALAVPAVGGVALDAAGVPLRRSQWLALLIGVTLVAAGIAAQRRRRTVAADLPAKAPPRGVTHPLGHPAVMVAAVTVAAAAVGLAVVGARAQPRPGFTQLWLVPEPGAVALGVGNFEGREQHYLVVLRRGASVVARYHVGLRPRQRWQRTLPRLRDEALQAALFRGSEMARPYRSVHLAGGAPQ